LPSIIFALGHFLSGIAPTVPIFHKPRPLFASPALPTFLNMDRTSFFSLQAGRRIDVPRASRARFAIGDVVRHREFDFRGVIFDIDPVFANSEEWYESIPQEKQPDRNQPYYHLFAESDEESYIAYVSQQNLTGDMEAGPVEHPALPQLFERFDGQRYRLRAGLRH
jgi:heat shock protein HspQ